MPWLKPVHLGGKERAGLLSEDLYLVTKCSIFCLPKDVQPASLKCMLLDHREGRWIWVYPVLFTDHSLCVTGQDQDAGIDRKVLTVCNSKKGNPLWSWTETPRASVFQTAGKGGEWRGRVASVSIESSGRGSAIFWLQSRAYYLPLLTWALSVNDNG